MRSATVTEDGRQRWSALLIAALGGLYLALLVLAALNVPGPDLFPLWAAGRGLLAGQSPYGPEVRAVIERDWNHAAMFEQTGVAYPLPMVLLVLPLTPLPYAAAKVALILLSLGGLIMAARLMRLPWPAALCFSPAAFGALLAQVTPLWGVLGVVLIWALERRRAWLVGLCIALLPAKPQSGLVLALAAYAWCAWNDRRALAWATGMTLLIWGGSLALVPTWPWEWLWQIRAYAGIIPANLFIGYLPALPCIALMLWYGRDWPSRALILGYVLVPQVGGYSPAVLLPLLRHLRGWVVWASLLSTCLLWLTSPISADPLLLTLLVLLPLALGMLLSAHGRRGE